MTDRINVGQLNLSKEVTREEHGRCYPRSSFQDLCIRTLLSSDNNTLFVRHEVFRGSSFVFVADATEIGNTIPRTIVSTPCPHGYLGDVAPTHPAFSPEYQLMRRDMRVVEGFILKAYHSRGEFPFDNMITISYQLVDNSPVGQWLACQWSSESDAFLTIIQKDCCFPCILVRVKKYVNAYLRSPTTFVDICVIAGGVQE